MMKCVRLGKPSACMKVVTRCWNTKVQRRRNIKPDPAFGVVGGLSNMLWIHRLVHLWDPWLLPDKDFYQKNQNQISIEI